MTLIFKKVRGNILFFPTSANYLSRPSPVGSCFPLFLTIGIAAIGLTSCRQKSATAAAWPSPTVEITEVLQRDLPLSREWVGTTDGIVNATIRAQVQGYLISRDYKEGNFVRKGQVLFRIDPRTFQADLEQAEAARDKAKADVALSEAQYSTVLANLNRIRPLAEQKAVSQKELDDAVGAERSAQASVVAAQASLSAAQATADRAMLNLEFTKIISPINGIAGIAQAQVGDLVGPQEGVILTTVSTIDPMKVDYSVSEQFYLSYIKKFVSEAAGIENEKSLQHELLLSDGSIYPFKGKISVIDRQIDQRTGTLRLQAIFPNSDGGLRPGQFVRVRVLTETRKGALLVPQQAVIELQGTYQVAVVRSDNRVDMRTVKLGQRIGTLQVIEEGIHPNEMIVVEGVQKVQQGIAVNAKPFMPGAQAENDTSLMSGKPEYKPATGGR
ncbi:MAG: efflux RND transporter periplasmic adaptor subunit [Chitinispirillaceae bacterium]|jgi:membrane fusion protein (multidrug efflux system)